jgi:hypothetical protein
VNTIDIYIANYGKEGKNSADIFAENSTDICPLKSCKNLAKLLGKVAMIYLLIYLIIKIFIYLFVELFAYLLRIGIHLFS